MKQETVPTLLRRTLVAGLLFAVGVAEATETPMWRPSERWRGFNLDAKAIKGQFGGQWREDDLEMMQALGFNFARAMIDYRYLCAPGTATPDPALFDPVDELLAWGRRHAIHVQLCLSIPPGTDYAVSRSKKRTVTEAACVADNVRCWDFIARRYRNVPDDADRKSVV